MATAELGGRPKVQNPPSVKMASLGNPVTFATSSRPIPSWSAAGSVVIERRKVERGA
jgi:hypothetical protein